MNQYESANYFNTTMLHSSSDNSSTNSIIGSNYSTGLDPSIFRATIVESNHHTHIGHYASMPILLSLPSQNSDETASDNNLVASVDGMTCFLDQEFQDCKNRLLMQTFNLPRSSIAMIPHQHARKEVTSFIKVSKSIT